MFEGLRGGEWIIGESDMVTIFLRRFIQMP